MTSTLSPLEQVKATVDPYAGREVFARLARGSVDDITPEDDVIMRWHGLYRHRPVEDGLFMLRLKLPGGVISAGGLRATAHIAERIGNETVDLTTRQDFQIHRLTLADLPNAFDDLQAAGVTTLGACGDQVRNVIACPLAGRDPEELFDTAPTAHALTQAFLANPAFANLPRKFKLAVSGCACGCVPVEINDLSLVAAHNREGQPGFALLVGGGLSAQPHLADPLGAWIAAEQAIEVVTRTIEIFRDNASRAQRGKARMKHLLAERGMAWFRAELETRLGYALEQADSPTPTGRLQDHLGVIPQRDGQSAIGIPVPAGRLRVAQVVALAELAETAGGEVRVTHRQNLLLPDVPAGQVEHLLQRLAEIGLPVSARSWCGSLVSCTGKEFCNKAVVHSKQTALTLLEELEATIPNRAVNLGISGCPNGCGQHALADIGLQGRVKDGEECFDILVRDTSDIGQRRLTAVPPARLAAEIRGLLETATQPK